MWNSALNGDQSSGDIHRRTLSRRDDIPSNPSSAVERHVAVASSKRANIMIAELLICDSSNFRNGVHEEQKEAVTEEANISKKSSFGPTRRKRRGIVEKRRRDRINSSLVELRNLILSATGKMELQDTSKLDKSEILQRTIDYLRSLQSKRNLGSKNVEAFMAGFQECISNGVTTKFHKGTERSAIGLHLCKLIIRNLMD
ncbi:hairy/enhancer-of-split related with YRPW motif protein 1-like [Paramacrobiotus metropolitanus]|uniref:hairy/enhancer-of-split related with YRPW motif protein 1-like n=1 Tax=Paramacrobiotus metropolitanus TaxID=2943436 RepID=UPI00244635B7|nr:hairy/enhancer-of-split related with YRPW motif protein 1-like [Paramacrobiotus metropolitanus]